VGAIRYSGPIRPVPTYTLPAKIIKLLGKFQPDSFKTERLVCVETDRDRFFSVREFCLLSFSSRYQEESDVDFELKAISVLGLSERDVRKRSRKNKSERRETELLS